MFQLRLFGKFKIVDGTGGDVLFESQSSGCVIGLLFLGKGRPISRQDLAENIWPDSTLNQQRANLRQALRRLPEVLKSSGLLQIGSEEISLDYANVTSDLQEAEEIHRQYLQDRDADDAPERLAAFWNVIRVPMLRGWDQLPFDALRTRYAFWADEIATELAELYEDRGQLDEASQVWRQLLVDNPAHLDAIKGLMRCESALRGVDSAEAVIHEILPSLSDSLLKSEIQKVFQAQKQSGAVPTGQLFRKRGPILLLVNLFERNLKRGGEESLRLLAAEVDSDFAIQHPKVFLSLIDTSLSHSSGWSDERKKLMTAAMRLASRSCEFEIGHFWADEVIESGPQNDFFLPQAITMKAFLYFEQREYAKAEQCFSRVGSLAVMQEASPIRSFFRAGMGGFLWQLARFDEAIAIYREDVLYGASLKSDDGDLIRSRALANLAYIAGAQHDWDRCVELGEDAISIGGQHALNSMVLLTPLGSAKIQVGKTADGIEDVKRGLAATAEAGMKRYHQLAIDFASTAVEKLRGRDLAQSFVDANLEHRRALMHFRSPAEIELLSRSGLLDRRAEAKDRMAADFLRQSPRTLNKLLIDSIQ